MRCSFQTCSGCMLCIWFCVVLYLIISDLIQPPFETDPDHHVLKRDFEDDYAIASNDFPVDLEVAGQKSVSAINNLPPGLKQEHVQVAFTSDENTLMGTVAAINSIWKNSRHPVKFLLVTNQKAYHLMKQWLENSELRDITYDMKIFDESLLEGKIKVRGGRQELAKPMNYARFFYPTLFPNVHGRVVHVDDDCIVQGDIYELSHTVIEDGHIIAVSDDCNSVAKRFNMLQTTFQDFLNFDHAAIMSTQFEPTRCSFNVGVYVVDLDRWRDANLTADLLYWTDLNSREEVYGSEKFPGGSQPPMMIALYNKHSLFDPVWHVRELGTKLGTRYTQNFIHSAKLLHWNGALKPWKGHALHTDIWDKYYVPDPSGHYKPARMTTQTT